MKDLLKKWKSLKLYLTGKIETNHLKHVTGGGHEKERD
jgi:hypothetical protein